MLEGMQRRGLTTGHGALAVLLLAGLLLGAARGEDPLLDRQYHVRKVRAPAAWEVARGFGQVIAVVDTGVDADHPDLKGRLVAGIDLVDRGTRPDDENGHGTFVAGVAAANLNNKRGGAGIANFAKVMPVRVLNEDGEGTSDIVAEGIRWATENGATVINLSLADVPGQKRSPAALITTDVELAIRQAALEGVVVVCAAGNEGNKTTPYSNDLPALVVGATDRYDAVWKHSNYDEETLFAPGVDIISTYVGEPYAEADGTSFSAPIVAGGAALLLQEGLNAPETRRRLIRTARPIAKGVGRVDIAAALGVEQRVRKQPKPPPSEQPQRKRSGDQREEPDEPEPIGQPQPLQPKRSRPKPVVEAPKPVRTPEQVRETEKAESPKLTKADRKEKRNRRKAPAPVPTTASEFAAVPGETMVDRTAPTPWPLIIAGTLLFLILVGIGGYFAAKQSG